jgi:hypothetical protein
MKSEAFVYHLHNTIIQQTETVALFIHSSLNYAEFQINLLTIIVRCDENFTICRILLACIVFPFIMLIVSNIFQEGCFFVCKIN